MNDNKDAFDLWCEWAEKPLDSMLTIDAAIHDAVMALPPDERRDRAKINAACAMVTGLARCGRQAVRTSTAFRRRRSRALNKKPRAQPRGSPIESRAAISTLLRQVPCPSRTCS